MVERASELTQEKPFFAEEKEWLRQQIKTVVSGEKIKVFLAEEVPSREEGKSIVKVGRESVGIVPKGFLENKMAGLIIEFNGQEPDVLGIGGVWRSVYRIPGELNVAVVSRSREILAREESEWRVVGVKTEWWVANKLAEKGSFWDAIRYRLAGYF